MGVNKDSSEQVETAYQSWHGKRRLIRASEVNYYSSIIVDMAVCIHVD